MDISARQILEKGFEKACRERASRRISDSFGNENIGWKRMKLECITLLYNACVCINIEYI